MNKNVQTSDTPIAPADRAPEDILLRARLTEFNIPPVRDCLVVGTQAPIGVEAIKRALSLLQVATFEHITSEEVDKSETIADVLIRTPLLRKISKQRLLGFITRRVEPYMEPQEILHLDLEVELTLEGRL